MDHLDLASTLRKVIWTMFGMFEKMCLLNSYRFNKSSHHWNALFQLDVLHSEADRSEFLSSSWTYLAVSS